MTSCLDCMKEIVFQMNYAQQFLHFPSGGATGWCSKSDDNLFEICWHLLRGCLCAVKK